MLNRRDLVTTGLVLPLFANAGCAEKNGDLKSPRKRVLISTDIGGTDPDDFQSMVHLLLYADLLEIEGLVSSPFGPGRKDDILYVIDKYAQDYPNISSWSSLYPSPDQLRQITKQGAVEVAPYSGIDKSTEGSNWIVECARRDDPRPLHVLVWGGIEDLAQALHDAPDIKSKILVYWIGGPNKKWSPDAYQYIADHHKDLWIIEANSTYRGWFVGGNQDGAWGNTSFVKSHVAANGALGEFFNTQLEGTIKMGDTPSVGWVLSDDPSDPTKASWGGAYRRAWARPYVQLDRVSMADDQMEVFGILELRLPAQGLPQNTAVTMDIENQSLPGTVFPDGTVRFRFSPKAVKTYEYSINSQHAELDGLGGAMTVVAPKSEKERDEQRQNWWTDHVDPNLAEGPHDGARTVSRWRESYLSDFALRMRRCAEKKSS